MSPTARTLLLVPLLALGLVGCNDDASVTADPPAPVGSSSSAPAPTSAAPVPPSSPPARATAAPAPTGSRAVAVYYVADTTNGPRLYREFHRRPATSAVIRDAVTAMLDQAPRDGDYTSLWADGTSVRGVRKDGSTAVVDLSRQAKTARGGAAFEGATLQQLVWTVTAADPASKSVRLLVEGKPVESLWGHVDTSRPMTRGRPENELGPVWILTPDQGGSIRRGGTFGGEATVFEATVSWELRQGSRVVKRGFSTATAGAPARGRWSGVADVPAGDYVLRAFESSARDGSETFVDDKRIRVV